METKTCIDCKFKKSLSYFYKQNSTRYGFRNICKSCWLIRGRKWKLNHPEKNYNLTVKKKYANIKERYGLGSGTIKRYGFKLSLDVYDKCKRECIQCHAKNDLTIHHIDHKGRNFYEKGLDRNDDIINLVVLCRRCHGSIHGKEHGKSRK